MTLPTPYVKPIRNKLGVAALIIVVAALVLLPLIAFILGVTGVLSGAQNKDTAGWAVLGGFVFAGFGFAVAGVVCLVGSVLAIIALTRKGYGKITAIIALVVGAPTAIFGTLLLIPYLQIL